MHCVRPRGGRLAALSHSGLPPSRSASQQRKHSVGAIRIVVPFGGGTPPDIISRIVARRTVRKRRLAGGGRNRTGGVTTIAGIDVRSSRRMAIRSTRMSVAGSCGAGLPGEDVRSGWRPTLPRSQGCRRPITSWWSTRQSRSIRWRSSIAYLKKEPGKHTFSSGGLRYARAPARRVVQARDRSAGDTCALPNFRRRSRT